LALWSRARPARGPAQVPEIADPERRAYLTRIAALMGARKDRIGEHTVTHAPPWATETAAP
jgi:hypothetical protein